MGSADRATLVRICDQAGRPRGTGFVADDLGTVVTSHEAVDDLERVLVRTAEGHTCAAGRDAITPLPEQALALIRTEGLAVRPLAVAQRPDLTAGTYVRLHAHGWREARVLGTTPATYTATDRFHTLDDALELAIGACGSEALRGAYEATGAPVLDATTGTVLAVLCTALHTTHRAPALAVPLTAAATHAPDGPLTAALRRNAATAPAHGPDLNLAGALELTAATSGVGGTDPSGGRPDAGPDQVRGHVSGATSGSVAASSGRGPEARFGYGPETRTLPQARSLGGEDHGLGGGRAACAGLAEAVARSGIARELDRFALGEAHAVVCALVGEPGTGRTTALRALAARRADRGEAAPTVWLRGADLRADDATVADAVGRALRQAGRVVAASGGDWSAYPGPRDDAARALPQQVARIAREAGRPLVVLLDGAEEMPTLLATHRLARWVAGTADWLRTHGVRLVLGSRAEFWEPAGELFPAGTLYRPDEPAERLPHAVPVGELSAREAEAVRERYGVPASCVAEADARHPLALRLLADVRAARPGALPGRPGRGEIFAAYLDLVCLRVARRIADSADAALVADLVHRAARRCLASGNGELDREAFQALFPRRTGAAVLDEGLFVAAGSGYRFADEEFGDWIQGAQLDVDAALYALVDGRVAGAPAPPEGLPSRAAQPTGRPEGVVPAQRPAPGAVPVARHRIGPVLQGLLLLERAQGPVALTRRLERLVAAAEGTVADAAWWAARLVREVLLRVPDARPYADLLRLVAGHLTTYPTGGLAGHGDLGPWFWERLRLGEDERLDLLRRLLPADTPPGQPDRPGTPDTQGTGPTRSTPGMQTAQPTQGLPGPRGMHGTPGAQSTQGRPGSHGAPGSRGMQGTPGAQGARGTPDSQGRPGPQGVSGTPGAQGTQGSRRRPRYLEAVAVRLAADPRGVQPLLCRWFTDDRPLPAEPGARVRPTVAGVAQALLHTHRDLAVDDLCEALVTTVHPRADQLLTTLVEDEPSAMCRAVDRWAHDDLRPARRVAAATYGRLLADRVTSEADRELLRYAALALLARPGDQALHGHALALLVRDPQTRSRYLPQALDAFRADSRGLLALALTPALATHPEPVLAAFHTRLQEDRGAAGVLDALATVRTPAPARRAAALVLAYVDRHPAGAVHAAAYVDRHMEQGPPARPVLFPLVAELLRGRPAEVRDALARVLAAPGTPASRALRDELLDVLLEPLEQEPYEAHDSAVPDTVLRAAALGAAGRPEDRTRELVLRTGRLLIRTLDGAACFDRRLAELARDVPGFAALVSGWLAEDPGEWATVVGPSTRRTVERLAAPAPTPTPESDPEPVAVSVRSAMPDANRAMRAWHP